jgi:DNA repair exonuclease SbcCD ATPase subunit
MKSAMAKAMVLSGLALASADHPIGKVIDMLKGLQQKSIAEGKEEALLFQKFEHWCKTTQGELGETIAEEKETIETLETKIEGQLKEKKSLEEKISKLTEELGKMEAAATKAKDARDEEHDLYEKADADFESTITAVESAIEALQDAKSDTSLLQSKLNVVLALTSSVSTPEQRDHLQAFLQTDPADVMASGDYAAHQKKYSFNSGNVVELLKTLLHKFEDDRLAAEKAETNALNAYDLAKKARDAAIDAAEDSKTEKSNVKADVEEALSQAESNRDNTKEDLDADSASLEETQKSCEVKTAEWDERSSVRKQELEAMDAAIKILAKVGGVRTEAPSNADAPENPLAFVQLDDPKSKVVTFLREQARVQKAQGLRRLAQEISAHLSGPFDEVNGMIEQMIFRLMAEQKDEDDHKNWCDQEVSKTNKMIDNHEDKLEELNTKLDAENAEISKLTEDISEADDMLLRITKFMKEATDVREEGKKENQLAIKDAQDAQTAVANAIAVLTDFYKESGEIAKEPYEFIQRAPQELPAQPSTWDSSYTGVADPKAQPGGIVTILETTAEEFAKMEADTKAQESSDEEAYQSAMSENDIEKSRRSKEAEMKAAEKKRRISKRGELEKKKKHTSDELETTEQYFKDLKPACIEGDSTYEDRKEARSKEIKALQMAQGILRDAFKDKSGFLQIRKHSQ